MKSAATSVVVAAMMIAAGADAQDKARVPMEGAKPESSAPAQAAAGATSARELLRKTADVLAPDGSTVRKVEIVTRNPDGGETTWYGREARGSADGKDALLLVLEDPPSVRGFAVLAVAGEDATHEMWAYTPPVQRVRKLEFTGMAQPFLGTDLTFGDLGLTDEIGDRDVRVRGQETVDGRSVTVIEAVPADTRTYARVLTYVTESGWPVRKEYRDVADRTWRVLTYHTADSASGEPTLSALRVRDVQTGYETELRYADSGYAGEVSESLFDPAALARVSEEQQLAGLEKVGGDSEDKEAEAAAEPPAQE